MVFLYHNLTIIWNRTMILHTRSFLVNLGLLSIERSQSQNQTGCLCTNAIVIGAARSKFTLDCLYTNAFPHLTPLSFNLEWWYLHKVYPQPDKDIHRFWDCKVKVKLWDIYLLSFNLEWGTFIRSLTMIWGGFLLILRLQCERLRLNFCHPDREFTH